MASLNAQSDIQIIQITDNDANICVYKLMVQTFSI